MDDIISPRFSPGRTYLLPLAPGDQVIRYVDGQPFFCTVVSVEGENKIRISCQQWPSGYSAVVNRYHLTAVRYQIP